MAMLDWDDLRFFLAVARRGHLSGAARVLQVAQPTVGRRIDALQKRLGTLLFQKTRGGHTLTASGRAVLRLAEGAETHALAIERVASGRDVGLSGVVRLTCTEWFARQVLPPLLARFAEAHPEVVVEVMADVRLYRLAQGEADVAVRFGAFPERAVLRRKLGRIGFGLYASPHYLARHGAWNEQAGAEGHRLVEMVDGGGTAFPDCAWLARLASRARVTARTTSRDAQAALALAGLGLATLPRRLGDSHTGLRRLATRAPVPGREAWLGAHRDTRQTPRVRALVEFLSREVPLLRPLLDP